MTLLNKYYEILLPIDRLALGFSSRVGRAIDFRSGDYVAFKVMRREYLTDVRLWKQFAIEAELLGHYFNQQPNAVKLIDCGFINDNDIKQDLCIKRTMSHTLNGSSRTV